MIHAQLDTTVLIGMIVLFVFTAIGLACSVWMGVVASWLWAAVGAGVTAVITAAALVAIWFPFGYAYNHYVPVSGTVAQVNTRFLGDGSGGTDESWVVWIGNRPYRCDDGRCGGLHKGSTVTLLCE